MRVCCEVSRKVSSSFRWIVYGSYFSDVMQRDKFIPHRKARKGRWFDSGSQTRRFLTIPRLWNRKATSPLCLSFNAMRFWHLFGTINGKHRGERWRIFIDFVWVMAVTSCPQKSWPRSSPWRIWAWQLVAKTIFESMNRCFLFVLRVTQCHRSTVRNLVPSKSIHTVYSNTWNIETTEKRVSDAVISQVMVQKDRRRTFTPWSFADYAKSFWTFKIFWPDIETSAIYREATCCLRHKHYPQKSAKATVCRTLMEGFTFPPWGSLISFGVYWAPYRIKLSLVI